MSAALPVLLSIVLLMAAICYLRLPIGMLLTLLGVAGYALLDGPVGALVMLGNEFWATFSSAGLTVVPLFVFMGQICFHSGLSSRLYRGIAAWIGHRRGGIAAATVGACGAFAAICGSNTATAATMSVVSLPEMRRYGYNTVFASGVIAAGTTLGAVIPPSVVAIVLGIQTGLSIKKLFMGGVVPGLLLLGLFLLTITWTARVRPLWGPAGERVSLRARIAGLPGLLEAFLLFGLVVGGLSTGVFTPTEAGAAGTALALAFGFARRGLGLRTLARALMETLNVSAMIFLLLAGAGCYGKFLSVSRTPFMVAEWVQGVGIGPFPLLLLILLVYLVGGMLMDALALLLITLPICFPLVQGMGYDPRWFALLLLVVTTMGAITPPVGASAYVVASMGRIPLGEVFRGTLVFIPAFLVCLAAMLALPEVVLWLPGLVD